MSPGMSSGVHRGNQDCVEVSTHSEGALYYLRDFGKQGGKEFLLFSVRSVKIDERKGCLVQFADEENITALGILNSADVTKLE